jgi:hypothetical protein
VQVLDGVVSGGWKMGEPTGKYMRLVKRFERWANGVYDLLGKRERGDGAGGCEEVNFVQDLDREWKDEATVLGRKLEGWREQLRDLGWVNGLEKSTLGVVLRGMGELVNGMLAEVQTMERIRIEVLRREEEWIKKQIANDSDEDSASAQAGTSVPGAIWRRY